MLVAENDKNANILYILDLAKNLPADAVRDLANVAKGISLARKNTNMA